MTHYLPGIKGMSLQIHLFLPLYPLLEIKILQNIQVRSYLAKAF